MAKKSASILFEVVSFEPDSIQYKPRKPVLRPKNPLYVSVSVQDKHILETTPRGTTLTLDGFLALGKTLAGLKEE